MTTQLPYKFIPECPKLLDPNFDKKYTMADTLRPAKNFIGVYYMGMLFVVNDCKETYTKVS